MDARAVRRGYSAAFLDLKVHYFLIGHRKTIFYLKAVFPPRNLGLMRISRSRFKQSKNCSLISRIYVLRCFVNFWVIFGDIWEEIVFLNGLVKFREIRNGEDLM